MQYAVLLYNPTSGKALIPTYLDYIAAKYQRAGITLIPLRIHRERNVFTLFLQPLIEELRPDHIVIAGGDGTINRYINWAMPNGISTPIAILPTGTANDFAKTLGIHSRLEKALDQILKGHIHSIDLGKVNDRYFVNILSGGLMTGVSQKTPTALKNMFGRVAYYFSVIGELPTFNRLDIKVESAEHQFQVDCLLFMVFNGRTAGNLPVARNASAHDGLLEVVIIKGDNIALTIGDLFHILLQKSGDYPDDIIYFQTPSLTIHCVDKAPTDLDGEKGSSFPMHIECLPQVLQVIY